MTAKRQRSIAKRLKRKPARLRNKARKRAGYNLRARADMDARSCDDCADLMAPLAIALMAVRPRP